MSRSSRCGFACTLLAGLILFGCGRSDPGRESPKEEVVIGPKAPPIENPPEEKSAPKAVPGQQTVTFLGSQGTGRRFCIIADCSMSLSPASFGRIRQELVRTLRSLNEDSSFHVMFFAGKPRSMPGGDWLKGGKDVDAVLPWIRNQQRVYGTVAAPAFARAFALKPPPDVIFFMTDGQIQPKDPEKVAALNKTLPPVAVHTILFVKEKTKLAKALMAEIQLKQIAKDAGGTFRIHRDGDK